MQNQPLSDNLVLRDDGRLYVLSSGGLFHPVASLRIPKGEPQRYHNVIFSIY